VKSRKRRIEGRRRGEEEEEEENESKQAKQRVS